MSSDSFWVNRFTNGRPARIHAKAWDREIPRVMAEEDIHGVLIDDWDGTDLSPLAAIAPLTHRLSFNVRQRTFDLSVLNEFSALEKLEIILQPLANVDFSCLPRLKIFSTWSNTPEFGNLSSAAASLETLHVTDGRLKDLEAFRALVNLRDLGVAEAPLKSLRGIEGLKQLEQLALHQVPLADLSELPPLAHLRRVVLHYLRRLSSIEGLERLPALEELWMTVPKALRDLERIGNLRQLRELWLDGPIGGDGAWLAKLTELRRLNFEKAGTLPTLSFLRAMPELERFAFTEGSVVADNDLSLLLELPRLRELFVQFRKGYHPSDEELTAFVERNRTAAATRSNVR